MSYLFLSQQNDSGLEFPVGGILAWPSNTIPSGWALCDGSAFNTTNNPTLQSILGGSTTLPDLRGAFLRQTGTNGTYSGPSLRGTQADSFISHTHTISNNSHGHTFTQANFGTINDNDAQNPRGGNPTNTKTTGQASLVISIGTNSSDTETAPYCYGINWIIKLEKAV